MKNVNIEKAFKNELKEKVLRDYTQFPFKILTGERGTSKTFPIQKILLDEYLKKGHFFSVIRETQNEIDNMLNGNFFDDYLLTTEEEYKSLDIKCVGNEIYINNVCVAVCISLNTYSRFRGAVLNFGNPKAEKSKKFTDSELEKQVKKFENFLTNTERVKNLFYDEFIPLTPLLKAEKRITAFYHILMTLFRFREGCKIFLAGNLKSEYDEFLECFNFGTELKLENTIKKSYDSTNKKPYAVWLHLFPNDSFAKLYENSVSKMFARNANIEIQQGGSFDKISFNKMPRISKRIPLCLISNGIQKLVFYSTDKKDVFLMKEKPQKQFLTYETFVFDIKKMAIDTKLISKQLRNRIQIIFQNNELYFENEKVYNIFIDMLPNKKERNVK